MFFRALHIVMATLLFISSMGLVLSKHYCKDELKSVALFVEASACHQAKKQCPRHAAMAGEQMADQHPAGCCDTDTDFLKVDDEQFAYELSAEQSLFQFIYAYVVSDLGLAPATTDHKTLRYADYKPPPLVCDLPVRLQTFLC